MSPRLGLQLPKQYQQIILFLQSLTWIAGTRYEARDILNVEQLQGEFENSSSRYLHACSITYTS